MAYNYLVESYPEVIKSSIKVQSRTLDGLAPMWGYEINGEMNALFNELIKIKTFKEKYESFQQLSSEVDRALNSNRDLYNKAGEAFNDLFFVRAKLDKFEEISRVYVSNIDCTKK